jgi:hypothetical protein
MQDCLARMNSERQYMQDSGRTVSADWVQAQKGYVAARELLDYALTEWFSETVPPVMPT